jgi:hypothetical protein
MALSMAGLKSPKCIFCSNNQQYCRYNNFIDKKLERPALAIKAELTMQIDNVVDEMN